MTDEQIREFINSAPLIPLKRLMNESEDFIRQFRSLPLRIQEVGAVRRGESEGRAIEVLIAITNKRNIKQLKANISMRCEDIDANRPDAWTMKYYHFPAVIYFSILDTFVAQQLITTGPEGYVRSLRSVARREGYRLDKDGFHKGDRLIVPFDESEILETIGLPYVPPQERAVFVTHVEGEFNAKT